MNKIFHCVAGHTITKNVSISTQYICCTQIVQSCADRGHAVDSSHQHTMYYCGLTAYIIKGNKIN